MLIPASIVGQGTTVQTRSNFPGSPLQYDFVFRTDYGLLFYYDGTRWLTLDKYIATFPGVIAQNPGGNFAMQMAVFQALDMYVERAEITAVLGATNNGTHYWNFTLNKYDAASAGTSMGTVDTSADSPSTTLLKSITVNAALGGSATWKRLILVAASTNSPTALDAQAALIYRLIGA